MAEHRVDRGTPEETPDPRLTAKQVLVAHIEAHHRRIQTTGRPFAQLSTAHGQDHHRSGFLDHYHEGANLGPGQHPLGWRTGRDVVVTRRYNER